MHAFLTWFRSWCLLLKDALIKNGNLTSLWNWYITVYIYVSYILKVVTRLVRVCSTHVPVICIWSKRRFFSIYLQQPCWHIWNLIWLWALIWRPNTGGMILSARHYWSLQGFKKSFSLVHCKYFQLIKLHLADLTLSLNQDLYGQGSKFSNQDLCNRISVILVCWHFEVWCGQASPRSSKRSCPCLRRLWFLLLVVFITPYWFFRFSNVFSLVQARRCRRMLEILRNHRQRSITLCQLSLLA